MIQPTAEQLRACLAVERWVTDVIVAGPYDSRDSLVDFARASATPLAREEIDEAVAHHPRIGERAAAGSFSAAEQASAPDATDAATNAAIAQGNADYERKFGRVFIIRAAGRTRKEILAELQRRLELSPEDEQTIVGEQLVEIAMLRLTATEFVDSPGQGNAAGAGAAGSTVSAASAERTAPAAEESSS